MVLRVTMVLSTNLPDSLTYEYVYVRTPPVWPVVARHHHPWYADRFGFSVVWPGPLDDLSASFLLCPTSRVRVDDDNFCFATDVTQL